MPDPVRWKYDVYGLEDRPEGEPKWRVCERPAHPQRPVLFKSDDLAECQRWIETKEFEGGYAKRRPHPNRTSG